MITKKIDIGAVTAKAVIVNDDDILAHGLIARLADESQIVGALGAALFAAGI